MTSRLDLLVAINGRRPQGIIRPLVPLDEDGDDEVLVTRELVIVIDGVSELDRWDSGAGLDPDELLNPELPLLPPADGTASECVVQRCACGDADCDALTATIRRTGDVIEWFDFRDHRSLQDVGPFTFDAGQYEEEVRRAHRERTWESRPERIARLVGETFRAVTNARPRSFDWSSANDERVAVSFTDHRPNPRAGEAVGEPLITEQGSWFAVESEELHEQHLGEFEIGEIDDAAAVAAIVARIETTDPLSWPKPSL